MKEKREWEKPEVELISIDMDQIFTVGFSGGCCGCCCCCC
jgi:hypothetical protein